jgi:polyisoprenoid-binding protein YceI
MSIEIKPGRYDIDPVHSSVEFSTRFVAARIRGTLAIASGTVEVAEDLLKSSVTAKIDVVSVHTGTDARDEHLRGEDFFDVANHPEAMFSSTGLAADGDRHILSGLLTIRGTTHPVELDLYLTGDGEDQFGNFRIGFRASTRVSRSAFGVSGNVFKPGGPQLIGDTTEVTLQIQAATPAHEES